MSDAAYKSGSSANNARTNGGPRNPKPATLGVEDTLGEGDSSLVLNVLPQDLADVAFENMRKEVAWQSMYHHGGAVPRLVAVEGQVDTDGSFPIYRHPADESPPLLPFSQTVSQIREHVQEVLNHPVNHVLIQHYRSGADYISEHSDKTIDVVRGSNIVNVSLGAQRVMTLRMKKDGAQKLPGAEAAISRPAQRIPLPHNSMFVLGPETNKKWLHGINHDNRPFRQKDDAERYQNGERISLTFRHIGTFLTKDMSMIYGQGSTGIAGGDTTEGKPKKEDKKRVVNGTEKGNTDTPHKLIQAFGKENGQSDFDWDKWYGQGSDVLHLKAE